MDERSYYEAYDDRYRQVHREALRWFSDEPSEIVEAVIKEFGVPKTGTLLELGCGEGRDAAYLLKQGYDVLATDISSEAIAFCKGANPKFSNRFQVLDCVRGTLEKRFDFIFAVAVIHMLVTEVDRAGFYRFIRDHLTENGVALICTMGDGKLERQSDVRTAFDLQERQHQPSGKTLLLAGTSCRMVSFDTFNQELDRNGLSVLKQGMTAVEPDFPQMMYAVVKRL